MCVCVCVCVCVSLGEGERAGEGESGGGGSGEEADSFMAWWCLDLLIVKRGAVIRSGGREEAERRGPSASV